MAARTKRHRSTRRRGGRPSGSKKHRRSSKNRHNRTTGLAAGVGLGVLGLGAIAMANRNSLKKRIHNLRASIRSVERSLSKRTTGNHCRNYTEKCKELVRNDGMKLKQVDISNTDDYRSVAIIALRQNLDAFKCIPTSFDFEQRANILKPIFTIVGLCPEKELLRTFITSYDDNKNAGLLQYMISMDPIDNFNGSVLWGWIFEDSSGTVAEPALSDAFFEMCHTFFDKSLVEHIMGTPELITRFCITYPLNCIAPYVEYVHKHTQAQKQLLNVLANVLIANPYIVNIVGTTETAYLDTEASLKVEKQIQLTPDFLPKALPKGDEMSKTLLDKSSCITKVCNALLKKVHFFDKIVGLMISEYPGDGLSATSKNENIRPMLKQIRRNFEGDTRGLPSVLVDHIFDYAKHAGVDKDRVTSLLSRTINNTSHFENSRREIKSFLSTYYDVHRTLPEKFPYRTTYDYFYQDLERRALNRLQIIDRATDCKHAIDVITDTVSRTMHCYSEATVLHPYEITVPRSYIISTHFEGEGKNNTDVYTLFNDYVPTHFANNLFSTGSRYPVRLDVPTSTHLQDAITRTYALGTNYIFVTCFGGYSKSGDMELDSKYAEVLLDGGFRFVDQVSPENVSEMVCPYSTTTTRFDTYQTGGRLCYDYPESESRNSIQKYKAFLTECKYISEGIPDGQSPLMIHERHPAQ